MFKFEGYMFNTNVDSNTLRVENNIIEIYIFTKTCAKQINQQILPVRTYRNLNPHLENKYYWSQ